MMLARKALPTLLIGAACMTGLGACGSSDEGKVSDASFIDACLKQVGANATAKAYKSDICKCAQDKLKAQGLGDKTEKDKGIVEKANAQIAVCAQEKVNGQ